MGRLPRVSAHTWWPSASALATIVPLKKPLPPMTSTFSIACLFLVMRACRSAACSGSALIIRLHDAVAQLLYPSRLCGEELGEGDVGRSNVTTYVIRCL